MEQQLLEDLSVILNAHQDIEDALRRLQTHSSLADIETIREANSRIGDAVARHLPG